jgi:hypothetical protein
VISLCGVQGEDWIWQIPVGTPQQVSLVLHQFQAGLRNYSTDASTVPPTTIAEPSRPIVMYVMALAPGQTPSGWRRSLFTSLAYGTKFVRNYRMRDSLDAIDGGCYADPEAVGQVPYAGMYHQTRRTMWELGGMDDILWGGSRLCSSRVAMLMSESTDIWQPADVARQFAEASTSGPAGGYIQASSRWGTLGSERVSLFILLQHAQLQIDIVTEDDLIDGNLGQYTTLFTAESHVSNAATRALTAWLNRGGTVIASANAGAKDEYNATNHAMAELLGIQFVRTEVDKQGLNGTIDFVKQVRHAISLATKVVYLYQGSTVQPPSNQNKSHALDLLATARGAQNLPFASVIDQVTLNGNISSTIDVVGWKSHFKVTAAAAAAIDVLGTFADASPAITRHGVGAGHAMYCGFLPGLSCERAFPALYDTH